METASTIPDPATARPSPPPGTSIVEAARLNSLLAIYMAGKPRLKPDEIQDLLNARMITRGIAVGPDGKDYPETAAGMTLLGSLIMRRFAGKPIGEVGHQRIRNWKKLAGVKRREGLIAFPNPVSANRYNVRECFDWVEKWIIPDVTEPGNDFGVIANTEAQIKQAALRKALREEAQDAGELINVNEAIAAGVGALNQVRLALRMRDERGDIHRRLAWLKEFGVSPDVIAKFQGRDTALAIELTNFMESNLDEKEAEINTKLNTKGTQP